MSFQNRKSEGCISILLDHICENGYILDGVKLSEIVFDVVTAAATHEREACAKVAEQFAWYNEDNCSPDDQHEHIAQAIRSRGDN